jgi:Arc/MetJ-type ribon-helix-helix transcriptional regulator
MKTPLEAPTRKTHTISLRLSAGEFEALQSLRSEGSLRSVSEFVRETMNRALFEKAEGKPSLEFKVQEIDGRLQVLDSEVARLSRLIEEHVETS